MVMMNDELYDMIDDPRSEEEIELDQDIYPVQVLAPWFHR